MKDFLKLILILILFILFASGCTKQNLEDIIQPTPKNIWQKTYGRSDDDFAYSIQQTENGGFIVVGGTRSLGAGSSDVYILKLSEEGEKEWEKTYGGLNYEEAHIVQKTYDGGYIVAGYANRIYVIKLDSNGEKEWERSFGDNWHDEAFYIHQTKDWGYIIVGFKYSYETQNGSVYLIKIDRNGNKEWEKSYSDNLDTIAYSMCEASDGGYIIVGRTLLLGNGWDIYVLKVDDKGNKIWSKNIGRSGDDEAYSVQGMDDGGYLVAGATTSLGLGNYDAYFLKINPYGEKVWEKAYGGTQIDKIYSLQKTIEGNYIAVGETNSFGAGGSDVYILKIDKNGDKLWEKFYGGSGNDIAYSIQQTNDGGYIVAGYTYSFGKGGKDVYIIKLDAEGNTGPYPSK
uniref:Lipoprotein n=1 Tax=Dictyoglomus thermophilum TaxID=14 RepID=A0A7C3RML4_DICTH